jgi:PAS domain-containing protein
MQAQTSAALAQARRDAHRKKFISLCVLAGSVAFPLAVCGWLLLRNERILTASEAWHRGLVDQALVGMFVCQDSKFRFLNRRIADMFG